MNLRPLACLVLPLALLACENKCLTLAKKVCGCERVASEVDTCRTRAESESSNLDITSSQEDYCESKIDTCSCDGLDTPEGQIACGLANAP
ncbi:MAG: hypothetical protein LBM75_03600 [Myxococcales bacterium]|jgi:hypothetical protein|nr:hypothetical protein [Myxococcales bacterium]